MKTYRNSLNVYKTILCNENNLLHKCNLKNDLSMFHILLDNPIIFGPFNKIHPI